MKRETRSFRTMKILGSESLTKSQAKNIATDGFTKQKLKTFPLKSSDMSKDFWQNQFNFVEEVLDSRFGYEVVSLSDEMDRVEFDTKTIFINSRCHP